jgi:hypothetical protein
MAWEGVPSIEGLKIKTLSTDEETNAHFHVLYAEAGCEELRVKYTPLSRSPTN